MDLLSLTDPIEDVLQRVAKRKGVAIGDLMVVVLDRPRHAEMITRIREAGARIRLISDGDVSGALLAVMPDTGVDLLWGVGGTPEGVLSAAAIRCVGGTLLGRLWPRDDAEAKLARDAGYDVERVLTTEDLVGSEDCFFAATGVTDGDLVRGVRFDATGATTQSLVMRGRSGTIRKIDAHHHRAKLRALMGDRYG
jgi:fructose-1,6-bisphosphatase II